MEEATFVAFNKGRKATKLVGLYPKEAHSSLTTRS
jgi:hypothetical protein